jgi:hypothetical protein
MKTYQIVISSGSNPPGAEPFYLTVNPGVQEPKLYATKAALWQDLSDCAPSACKNGLAGVIEQLKQKTSVEILVSLSPECLQRLSVQPK